MNVENKKDKYSKILIPVFLTAIFSLAVGIIIFHYTSKEPQLTYTIFPISGFKTTQTSISIYNVQIENIGNKEAEDVQVSFTFPKGAKIIDYNMELSDKTINFLITDINDLRNAVFKFPLINPTENSKFSFLAENAEHGNVKVYLRGRGLTGEMKISKKDVSFKTTIYSLIPLILGITIGMATSYYSVMTGYKIAEKFKKEITE